MPSFDVVSEVDKHELTNAVDQANRELTTRFDFKGSNAKFELDDLVITVVGASEFQLKQMRDILTTRLATRKIDLRALETADPAMRQALFAVLSVASAYAQMTLDDPRSKRDHVCAMLRAALRAKRATASETSESSAST